MKSSGKSVLQGLLCLVMGVLFLGYGIYNLVHDSAFYFKGETMDMNQMILNGETIPVDTYMTLTTNSVLGNYAETKHTYGFIPIGKDEHYVVYLDDGSFLSVTVKGKKDVDLMEQITDETWAADDYYANTGIVLVGRTHNLTGGELHGYYRDAFSQMGVDMDSADSPVRYMSLDASENRARQWIWEIAFFLFGIVSLFGCLSLFGVFALGNKTVLSPTPAAGGVVNDPNADLNAVMGAAGQETAYRSAFSMPQDDSSVNGNSDYQSVGTSSYTFNSASGANLDTKPEQTSADYAGSFSSAQDVSNGDELSDDNDLMDSFRNGYEEMMEDKKESSGSGLKLKI